MPNEGNALVKEGRQMRITMTDTLMGIDRRMTPREAAREIVGRAIEAAARRCAENPIAWGTIIGACMWIPIIWGILAIAKGCGQ